MAVGMYDFQIKEDAAIAKEALSDAQNRKHPRMTQEKAVLFGLN